jgi:hypothetical protein
METSQRLNSNHLSSSPVATPVATHEGFMRSVPQSVRDILAVEIPVVVCRPRRGWKTGDSNSDVTFPDGWQTITYKECLAGLLEYRPGVDALAMVAGHGVDVVDLDSKMGASLDDLPVFRNYGIVRTPSGGWHLYVPSTGFGKRSPLRVNGNVVGDYCGGTQDGGSRMLVFLPGSVRPKYPNATYVEETPIDLNALLDSEPDPMLITMLEAAGATTLGSTGEAMADEPALQAFLSEHEYQPGHHQCQYGRAAINGMFSEVEQFTPNGGIQGRHGWATRSCTRLVELMRAGCATTQDYREIEATLQRIKPEGGSDIVSIMRWALANATGESGCTEHGQGALVAWTPELQTQAVVSATSDSEPTPQRSYLQTRLLTRSELNTLPEPDPLIERTIEKRSVIGLSGDTGTCKTFMALDMASCLATGKSWHGRDVEQGPVLYIASEGAYGLQSRIQTWEYVWDSSIGDHMFQVIPIPVQITHREQQEQLLEILRQHKPILTVVDTLARCAVGLDENSAKDMGMFIDSVYRMRDASDGSVLVVHHTNKSGDTRGSTAFKDGVDTMYLAKGDASLTSITRTKRKDGPHEDTRHFRLRQAPPQPSVYLELTRAKEVQESEASLEAITQIMREHFGAMPASPAAIAEVANQPVKTLYRRLKQLREGGRIINVGTLRVHRYVLAECAEGAPGDGEVSRTP